MFLAIGIPSLLIVLSWLMNNTRFNSIERELTDIRQQIQHFIDLHLGHETRIAKMEERTK